MMVFLLPNRRMNVVRRTVCEREAKESCTLLYDIKWHNQKLTCANMDSTPMSAMKMATSDCENPMISFR